MIYFIIPILLTIYFELLGRWLLFKFNKKMHIYFPIGFLFIIAIIYPSLLITINNLSFYLLLAIYIILFVASVVLIIKDFNKIDKKIYFVDFLIVLVTGAILTYYSINTTLGDLHGFDSLYYINFTVNNIGKATMNSRGIYLNGPLEESLTYYTGQTYYYFASVILYLFGKICTLLRFEYFYETAFIWIFQILFSISFVAVVAETFNRTKNKWLAIIASILLIFYQGRLYFNNVYGFFGNSMLIISISYMSMFLYDYLCTKKDYDRLLMYLMLIAGCSFSSSGIFIMGFVLVGLFFLSYDNTNLLKEYSVIVLFPFINVLNMERFPIAVVYLIPILFSFLLYLLNKTLSGRLNNRSIKYVLLICIIIIFITSRFYSNGLFDFTGLLNNTSQVADMSLDYFYFNGIINLENLFKVFIIVIWMFSLYMGRKDPIYRFFIVLFLLFFNPFCCNVVNYYIKVYYRAYSIFINPFIIVLSIDYIYSLKKNIINYVVCFLLIITTLYINFSKPIYYHYEHTPLDNYDYIYKMSKDEIDIIRELKSQIYYYNEEKPYIITDNLLTQGMINDARYLFGRTYFQAEYWEKCEKKLYEIFYPQEYLDDNILINPDYENMLTYIKDAGVNFIVISKKAEYYDRFQDNYSYLFYKVDEMCNTLPIYENDSYVIYHF